MYIHIDAINTYSRTCLSYQYALSGTSPLLFFLFAIFFCHKYLLRGVPDLVFTFEGSGLQLAKYIEIK